MSARLIFHEIKIDRLTRAGKVTAMETALKAINIQEYHKCKNCPYLDPASCKTVKELGLSNGDGEYDLYLLHPVCSKPARVYCADMNTDNPLEYVTLSAGRSSNYAFNNRPSGHAKREGHAKTAFDKVRMILGVCNFVHMPKNHQLCCNIESRIEQCCQRLGI